MIALRYDSNFPKKISLERVLHGPQNERCLVAVTYPIDEFWSLETSCFNSPGFVEQNFSPHPRRVENRCFSFGERRNEGNSVASSRV